MSSVTKLVPLATALLLSACGITLETTRISDSNGKVATLIPGEGITLALPRTEYEVIQPVQIKVPIATLQSIFDDCRLACSVSVNNAGEACEFSTEPKISFPPPELKTVAAIDYSRVYRVYPSTGIFNSSTFKFDVAANGMVDKSDMSSTNMTYEFVSSVASTAIKAFTYAASASVTKALLASKPSTIITSQAGQDTARSCYAVSVDVDKLIKRPVSSGSKKTLSCGLLQEIDACMSKYVKDVETATSELNTLFDGAVAAKVDSKLLDSLAANRQERVKAAVEKRNITAARFGLSEGKPKEAQYQVVMRLEGPGEFTDDDKAIVLSDAIQRGSAKLKGISDNSQELLGTLVEQLGRDNRVYVVASRMPASITVSSRSESDVVGNGYRYRVPVSGEVTLTVYDNLLKNKIVFGPLSEQKLIAQYGPIAALPSRFDGKTGRVMVKHWPESGGLQTIEIGADAIPTTSATSVLDTALGQYKAKVDQDASAAAAAAKADPELTSLTRQQQILSLKKQIKDLETYLK